MPETSIVIRTYNEEKHLGNLLRAISEQDYKDYEIIIVDSSSTDRTREVAKEFGVKVITIESQDFTFGYALNVGCKEAQGKYLVFASAHVLPINKHWLSNLTLPFQNERVAMIYGGQVGNEQSKFSERKDFKRIFGREAFNSRTALNYANNANSATRKNLWEEYNFDEYLFGLEDIDWARHMAKKGHLIHYEPKAAIYHIHQEEWHQVFNRYRREAIASVRIGLPHPPQARTEFPWLLWRLADDAISSFPNWSPSRLEEILRFRYYQWKGSWQGWFRDRELDLNRDKQTLFFSEANRVVVIEGKHKAKLTKTSLPEMKPGDVLIKVDYVGICRTDLEIYDGSLGYYRDGLAKYPIVPGHEFSGIVAKIGASAKYREHFKVGEKVVGECILSRGEIAKRKEVGVINHNGAYAQFIVVPGSIVHHVKPGVDQKMAVLTEPLAVVLRAIRRIKHRLSARSTIAVIGVGPIGNLCVQVLSNQGYKVTIYDKNPERLKLLENKVEATNTEPENLSQFDVIVEVTGSFRVLKQILTESRFDSTLLLLGFPYGNTDYNFEDLVGNEKVIVGSVGAEEEDFDKALKLLPELDTAPFTQVVMPLEDFEKAWKIHQTGKYLKILLKP
ncbi:MAG: glycosyltransferase [Candidatus Zambryskibacteria bacterium]|nr:glycosyltransferase [Candidatus Zambryskibacteria bacterium]